MAAVWKRVCQLSLISGFGASKSKGSLSSSLFQRAIFDPFPVSGARHFSQSVKPNRKHLFLVDTLALLRRLEGDGVPSKQAEVITAAFTEVLNDSLENVYDSLENVSQSLVSMGEMQKIEMMQECNLSKFKAEVQSSQGHHFSHLQHETEKLNNDIEKMRNELRNDIEKMRSDVRNDIEKMHSELRNDKEKMRSELRYEIDKVTAGQRLDLNLEKGRMREELSNQNAETNNLANKLDKEIHSLKAQLEAAKYDVIKYCIGTIVSISAVGLAVLRILM